MTPADPSAERHPPGGLRLTAGSVTFTLMPGRSYLLGSDAGCDIVLSHPSLAAIHARLRVEEGRLHVEDDSGGWTFVAGREVRRAELGPGESVVLGNVPVEVLAPPAPPATAPPAAAPSRPRYGRPSDRPLREHDELTFGERMADELRRAPWFTLSLLLHLLVLLVLVVLTTAPPRGGRRHAEVGIEGKWSETPAPDQEPEQETEIVADPAPEPPVEIDDPFELPPRDAPPEPKEPLLPGRLPPAEVLKQRLPTRHPGDVLRGGHPGLDTGGFVDKVGELRESGLEIVFVFDSTGSMHGVLDSARRHIERTLRVLQALIPDARVGIVTYRDHGRREAYLTRSIPLGNDYFRAANFMQGIRADGGGDPPEAIGAALDLAFEQRWRPGARRVVVLVGDAPAHTRDQQAAERATRRFASDGLSTLHAVVTATDIGSTVERVTRRCFDGIARSGGGEVVHLEDAEILLPRILTLAFGREYSRNIDEVFRIIEDRRAEPSPSALRVAATGDSPTLRKHLRRRPVDPDLIQALVHTRSRKATLELIAVMADDGMPRHARHAAAYAVQRLLDLSTPPLDPTLDVPIRPRARRELERRAVRELDDG